MAAQSALQSVLDRKGILVLLADGIAGPTVLWMMLQSNVKFNIITKESMPPVIIAESESFLRFIEDGLESPELRKHIEDVMSKGKYAVVIIKAEGIKPVSEDVAGADIEVMVSKVRLNITVYKLDKDGVEEIMSKYEVSGE